LPREDGGTYTIDTPVTAQCATTEIPNETKPGNGVFDPSFVSDFCSPLRALTPPQ
jgi:hypothetical protein